MQQKRILRPWQRVHAIAFALGTLLVGLWLRFHDASAQLLGGDELHAIHRAAGLSYGEALRFYGQSDNSIPLTLYAKLLMNTIGLTELRFRAPVMLSGVLLFLSPLFFSRRIGLWSSLSAMALFATSPPLVYFTLLARPYAPAALLVVLALLSWEYWLTYGRLRAGMGFALAGALATFFHLFCLFPIATLAALAIFETRRPNKTPASRRQIMLCLAFLLVLLTLLFGPGTHQLIVSRAAKIGQTELRYSTLLIAFRQLVGMLPSLQLSLLLLLPMGVFRLARHAPRLGRAAALIAGTQLAAICMTRPTGGGGSWARYFFVVWPVFLILSTAGVEQAVRIFAHIRLDHCNSGFRSDFEATARIAGALVALGIALWLPGVSPIPLYRLPHTNFRTGKASLMRLRPLRQALPLLFRRVAADPERGELLIVPYDHHNKNWERLALYQRELGVRIKMAYDRGQFDRRRGVHFANLVDVRDTEALAASGARYLILDPARLDTSVAERIRERFGPPVSRDGVLELYRLDQHRAARSTPSHGGCGANMPLG